MSKETGVEWCDSTGNLQMGCAGCELWIPSKRVRSCYAGILTGKYAGKKGWPKSFDKPEIFADRLQEFLSWSDLTGTKRPLKPWLDGLPRIIFLNDMGDTFTPGLPKDWLKPFLPRMAASPHQWLILTKQAAAMADFERENPFPKNVWPGVSVTSENKLSRLDHLLSLKSGGPRWVSYEPALGPINWAIAAGIDVDWIIAGGISGMDRATSVEWLEGAVTEGRATFIKQLGSMVQEPYYLEDDARREWLLDRRHKIMIPGSRGFTEWSHSSHGQPAPNAVIQWKPTDNKGGDMSEWPERLRVRQMPQFEFAPMKVENVEQPKPSSEKQRSLF